MHLEEHATEQFTFTCPGCGHRWSADYESVHVEDHRGHENDYYFRNGLPSLNPTAFGSVACPACARSHIRSTRVSRRIDVAT
ncbi:hypothetical protein [Antrihabitans cavernicola]|uniref:C2H2-type domain-containing protein n=1 Tax=Antrihabitans cavernicola TaxID=2495913 RepID=A0A5A7S818_9NOCA|nr:hypothetical protein [Spelaeibacter cavernicola]KAA0021349.1 hypothetical protein FOY51_19065 [Spelaeibacter cavernicola]